MESFPLKFGNVMSLCFCNTRVKLIDVLCPCFCQGGCRTGMAKVTNAYDLPARFVHWLTPFVNDF